MPALTGNTALDLAIGLAFVFLLFSVLCSAVQEGIASILDLRAKTLEKGLRTLLDDDGQSGTSGAPTAIAKVPGSAAGAAAATPETGKDWTPGSLTNEVLGQGLIRTTYKDAGPVLSLFGRQRRGPSYIPAQTFALALLNVVAPTSADDPIEDVRRQISASTRIPAGTRSALGSLASGAAKDRDQLRKEIEDLVRRRHGPRLRLVQATDPSRDLRALVDGGHRAERQHGQHRRATDQR